jgi:hypothetical protein
VVEVDAEIVIETLTKTLIESGDMNKTRTGAETVTGTRDDYREGSEKEATAGRRSAPSLHNSSPIPMPLNSLPALKYPQAVRYTGQIAISVLIPF